MKLVSRGKRPPRLENLPLSDRAAWKLIKRCWVKEAVRRSAMEDVAEKMMAWKLNCVFMEIMNDLVHGSYALFRLGTAKQSTIVQYRLLPGAALCDVLSCFSNHDRPIIQRLEITLSKCKTYTHRHIRY